MANNAAYWKKRFEYLEASQNRKGLECYAEIEQHYRKAEKQIEQEIRSWYQRFADNNQITLSEARKMLTSKELAEFKWDVNDYIKYGQENALNGQWTKQLENASARYHISRLESLEMQMQQQVEVLFGNQLDALDSAMRDVYTNGYYHTAFEIQKGIGVGWDFAKLDTKTINKVINKPWAVDGRNFSARIWDDREKLVNEINQTLVQNIVLGQDPQKAIDAIAHRLDVSKSNAGRLVMTEEAYFASESQHDCFKELDVEQFEVVETLDHTTCDTCAEMDGKVFPMSQWEVGVTVPPFHPWCRGTTVPAFGDEFDKLGERAARDEEGNYYTVPADMTYKQWENQFVNGGDKSGLQAIPNGSTIRRNYDCELAQAIGKENYDKIHDMIDACPDENLKKLWEIYEGDVKVASIDYAGTEYCTGDTVFLNLKADIAGDSIHAPYETIFHEVSHAIDYLSGWEIMPPGTYDPHLSDLFQSDKFTKTFLGTIKADVDNFVDDLAKTIKQEFKAKDWASLADKGYIAKWDYDLYVKYGDWIGKEPKYSKSVAYQAATKEIRQISDKLAQANISDIMGGATKNKIIGCAGHKTEYWNGSPQKLAHEAFAEFSDATLSNNASLEMLKKYLPESYAMWQEMIKQVVS